MADRSARRVLPIGHEGVRRRLDLAAGEGTSTDATVQGTGTGGLQRQATVQATPRKHKAVLRGIRKNLGGLRTPEINDCLLELEREDLVGNLSHLARDDYLSDEDLTPDESEEEYVPEVLERRSEVNYSSASDSSGQSEGDGPAQRGMGGARASRARSRGRGRRRNRRRGGRSSSSSSREGRGRGASSSSRGEGGSDDGRDGSDEEADVQDAGWSDDPTPPRMHPFTATPGLTVPVPQTPLGFVQLFLTRELLEFLTCETNDYARYLRTERKVTTSYPWVFCSVEHMAHYLGLQVFFGIFHASDVRWYWKKDCFCAMPNVVNLMSRDRFLAMDRYFHAYNRRAVPRENPDRLLLVRPVLEHIRGRCKDLVIPSKNLSLDEGMMAYKGRLSIKVYNPKKPKKYGVKFFFLTESTTGYVIDFQVYSGMFSTLRDTVFGLVSDYRHSGYHLFMDNYYNSVALAQELYDQGIHVSGTLRLVRGAPTSLKQLGKQPQRLAFGMSEWKRKDDVFVICWKGARLVPMITTSHEPIQERITQRRKTKTAGRVTYEEIQVERPRVIGHYNQHMGGVDLFDQLIQYYPFTRRTRRWTHKLTKYLLQLAIQNGYVLYCAYSTDVKKLSHLQFMEEIGKALVNFNDEDWPLGYAGAEEILRAPDLPANERADYNRVPTPHPRRVRPRASSSESDPDDPDDLPAEDAPITATPPPAAAPAVDPSPPSAAAASSPALPMHPPDTPSRRVTDPAGRLRPGSHNLVLIQATNVSSPSGTLRQKRCRVCAASGIRKDTRFECESCNVALCRQSDCFHRYHTLVAYARSPASAASTGRRGRRGRSDQ